MIEKEIKITADTDDALKEIKTLFNTMVDAEKKAQQEAEKLNDEVKEIGKTSKEGVKGVKNIGKAFKGVGLAVKAIGIGLLLQAFGLLKDLLSKNQKVVDLASTAFEGLSIAFNDLFGFVTENFLPAFERLQTFFNNLTFDKIKTAIQENLIERFQSALEVLGFLGEAVVKFFKGDFSGALDSAKEAGKEFVDVMTGVDDTVGKVSEVVTSVTDAVIGYTKSTLKAAEANVQLKNTAELAAAQQGLLIAKLEGLAEAQRKIRDDESLSVSDRIEANDKLLVITEQLNKKLQDQANIQIQAAKINRDLNKGNIQAEAEYQNALTNRQDLLNQIQNQQIEQNTNKTALQREAIELDQTITDAETERRIAQLEFDANQELNEIAKLERLRERLDEENIIIEEDLKRKQELYEEGTQARTDAEQEYLTKKQEISNNILLNEQELKKAETFEAEQVKNAKIAIANQTLNILGSLAKEGSALSKGIAASQATINTFQGVTSALSAVSTIPEPFGSILKFANAAAVGVSGAINVKKILSTKPVTTSAPNTGGGTGAPPAPSFNLVEGTGSNQIADTIQNQDQPIKAFVVSGDVTSSQELDRNIIDNASL